MTENQISEIVRTNKFTIKGWDFINHYDMALFLMLPSVLTIFIYFPKYEVDNFLLSICGITIIISLYIWIYQGPKQTTFTKIKIPELNQKEIYLLSLELVRKLNWEITEENSVNYIKSINPYKWRINPIDIGQSIIIIPSNQELQIISLYANRTSATFYRPNKNDTNIKRFKNGIEVLRKKTMHNKSYI